MWIVFEKIIFKNNLFKIIFFPVLHVMQNLKALSLTVPFFVYTDKRRHQRLIAVFQNFIAREIMIYIYIYRSM